MQRAARVLLMTASTLTANASVLVPCAAPQSGVHVSEPFQGRWLMNVAKSTFFEPSPPSARVLIIERSGADFVYSIETTNADRSTTRLRYTVPVQGGKGRFLEGPYDGVVHRRLDARTREAEYLQTGKIAVAFTGRVSDDGRSLRIIVRRRDAQGRESEAVTVYEKQ